MVELLVELAVVGEPDLDGQALAVGTRQLRLLLRHRDAHAADAVLLGRVLQRTTPATTDVQHLLAGFQPSLPNTRSSLASWASSSVRAFTSRHSCRSCAGRACARRDRCRCRSGARPPGRHEPGSAGLQAAPGRSSRYRASCAPAVEPRREQFRDQPVEVGGIPPTVHIGLADADGTFRQHPRIEARIPYLDIGRSGPVYLYITLGEEPGKGFSGSRGHRAKPNTVSQNVKQP